MTKTLSDGGRQLFNAAISDAAIVTRRGDSMHTSGVSVLSWNILADVCLQGQLREGNPGYAHVLDEMKQWSVRRVHLLQEIISSSADVVCLQEVDKTWYDA